MNDTKAKIMALANKFMAGGTTGIIRDGLSVAIDDLVRERDRLDALCQIVGGHRDDLKVRAEKAESALKDARRKALEDAEKLADERAWMWPEFGPEMNSMAIKVAIRALIEKEPT